MKKEQFKKSGLFSLSALMLLALCFTSNLNAQSVEITPSYGYQFGSKLNYGFNNYLKMNGSEQWGIQLGYEAVDNIMVEVSYVRHGTELSIRDVALGPNERRLSDLAVDWIMLGGTSYFSDGQVRPFLGGALGLAIFSPSNENRAIVNGGLNSRTEFAFSFKGGVNIMITENVGINLQGNLMFPVQWGGVYVGVGSGGVGTGVAVTSTTLVGGFSGGLVFKI